MKKTVLIFGAVLFLGFGQVGKAAYYDGNELLVICESQNESDFAHCSGYLAGAVDYGHTMSRSIEAGNPLMDSVFCMPDGAEPATIRLIFILWAYRHPEQLDQPASAVINNAFRFAFPCENQ